MLDFPCQPYSTGRVRLVCSTTNTSSVPKFGQTLEHPHTRPTKQSTVARLGSRLFPAVVDQGSERHAGQVRGRNTERGSGSSGWKEVRQSNVFRLFRYVLGLVAGTDLSASTNETSRNPAFKSATMINGLSLKTNQPPKTWSHPLPVDGKFP